MEDIDNSLESAFGSPFQGSEVQHSTTYVGRL